MNIEHSAAAARRIVHGPENFNVTILTDAISDEEKASIAEEELRYAELLSEVLESAIFTDEQKIEISSLVSNLQEDTFYFVRNSEAAIGASNALTIYKGISQKIAAILRSAKYYMEFGDALIKIPVGSKEVDVTTNPSEILRALRFISEAMDELSNVPIDTRRPDNVARLGSNLELGYVSGTDDKVLLITKAERSDVTHPTVRGRPPRINFAISIGGVIPSAVAEEREQTCLSIRFDYANGDFVVDIGGRTENPNTPDFTVAKCISLGAFISEAETGDDEKQSYHIRVSAMTPSEFSQMVWALRTAIPLSPTPLRVPSTSS
jgi:hypothetical protein